jgi:hypothetical protein
VKIFAFFGAQKHKVPYHLPLNEACARINARHDGGLDVAKALADEAGGLEPRIIFAKRTKVMITRNIFDVLLT